MALYPPHLYYPIMYHYVMIIYLRASRLHLTSNELKILQVDTREPRLEKLTSAILEGFSAILCKCAKV